MFPSAKCPLLLWLPILLVCKFTLSSPLPKKHRVSPPHYTLSSYSQLHQPVFLSARVLSFSSLFSQPISFTSCWALGLNMSQRFLILLVDTSSPIFLISEGSMQYSFSKYTSFENCAFLLDPRCLGRGFFLLLCSSEEIVTAPVPPSR